MEMNVCRNLGRMFDLARTNKSGPFVQRRGRHGEMERKEALAKLLTRVGGDTRAGQGLRAQTKAKAYASPCTRLAT